MKFNCSVFSELQLRMIHLACVLQNKEMELVVFKTIGSFKLGATTKQF